jgi:acyl carrier protein
MSQQNPAQQPAQADTGPGRERIADWLVTRVADYLRMAVEDIDTSVPLAEYGLDSLHAVAICGEVEDEFELAVDPTLLWDNPTIDALSTALDDKLPGR